MKFNRKYIVPYSYLEAISVALPLLPLVLPAFSVSLMCQLLTLEHSGPPERAPTSEQ